MKLTDFAKVLPELRAWLDSREATLESASIDLIIADPKKQETALIFGRLAEIRHLKHQLAHIERTQAEEADVCLGW